MAVQVVGGLFFALRVDILWYWVLEWYEDKKVDVMLVRGKVRNKLVFIFPKYVNLDSQFSISSSSVIMIIR